MGKEFIEYRSDTGRMPYSAHTVCCCLTQYVRNYIATSRSKIANIDEEVRDAVLVDAINYLASQVGVDFGLSTELLHSSRVDKETVDGQCLLTLVQNFYSMYIFQHGIVKSVWINRYMNDCKDKIDANDGARVLVDFINYLAEVNDYDRKFTMNDLYEKFRKFEHDNEMNILKEFLEKVSKYSERLANGESIDTIYSDVAREHNLKYISEDGTYHYTDIIRKRAGRSEMRPWDARRVEEEIYAMAYAYGKMAKSIEAEPQTKIIIKKILEMQEK